VITAKATDNGGAVSTSQAANVTISPVMMCTTTVASQGSFSVGYKCTYETVGSNVTITFELLDTDKQGVVAYLWKQTPFTETSMTNTTGNIFTATVSGLTAGTVISYAVKFAYSGGMAVTNYISYTIGSNCSSTGIEDIISTEPFFYPNPVQDNLYIVLPEENNRLILFDILGTKIFDKNVTGNYSLDMSELKKGIYFLKAENSKEHMTGKLIKK